VVAGAPVAQRDAKGVCGHDSDSFYLWVWLPVSLGAGDEVREELPPGDQVLIV
jgi:hypothetical protein